MASSLSINGLIAQLPPGLISPSSRTGGSPALGPSPEPGVVFARQQAPPAATEGQPRLVYARKDAAGPRGDAVAGDDPGRSEPKDETARTPADAAATEAKSPSPADAVKKPNGELLSKAEAAVLRELQQADQAVRAHEMAHLSAAGGYATGGATFSYQRGPDGQNYAVGGEVQIDTGKEATPEATIVKMQIVRQAALAPADPSPQDQRVASYATLQISEASKELLTVRSSRGEAQPRVQQESGAEGETARDIYRQVSHDMGQGGQDSGTPAAKKAFSAYRAFTPPLTGRGNSAVDLIA